MTSSPPSSAARPLIAPYPLGLMLITASTVAWSTAGYFTRAIPLDAWTTLFWRGVFGVLTGLVCVAAMERGRTFRALIGIGRPGLIFAGLSTVGMVSFFAALKLTTVAHVAIIYAIAPFLAAAVAWLAIRERATNATLAASAVALAGVALTVAGGLGEGSLAGDLLAATMTLVMAAAIVFIRASATPTPMLPAALLSALLSSLVSLPFATPLAVDQDQLVLLALFGATNMSLGLILFLIGARLIPAAETALIGALEAPLAPLWVWLAFDETPKPTTILGGVIVLSAVLGHGVYENWIRTGSAAPRR